MNPICRSQAPVQATCSCGSGIPVQNIHVNGQTVTLIALPLIFQHFYEAGKSNPQVRQRTWIP